MSKFRFPHLHPLHFTGDKRTKKMVDERDQAIEDYLNNLATGSGLRPATIVFGHSDYNTADEVDVLCTGTADNEKVQAVLDALRPNGPGTNPLVPARLLFLPGIYDWRATCTPYSAVEVAGSGTEQTIFKWNTGVSAGWFFDCLGSGENEGAGVAFTRFTDVCLDGNGLGSGITWNIISNGTRIDHCLFDSCPSAIAGQWGASGSNSFIDYYVNITENRFYGCGGASLKVLDFPRRLFWSRISGNVMENAVIAPGGKALSLGSEGTDGGVDVNVSDNVFDGDVFINDTYSLTFADNHMLGLDMTEVVGATVAGNHIEDDFNNTDADHMALSGNVVWGTYTEATSTNMAYGGNLNIP